jgi:protein TonB
MTRPHLVVFATAVLLVTGAAVPVYAQDALAPARTLYASAAYEEALGALERIKTAAPLSATEARDADQYRVLCLLALGRAGEAERTIEVIVAADPFFTPDDEVASPRVRTAFQTVRRRLLPGIAQQRYGMAKATLDRKEYAAAAEQFKRVVALLDDPDIRDGQAAPGLADLRVLASGFLDLAVAATPPPPAPAPPPVTPPPPPVSTVPKIYEASEQGLTLPTATRQDVPSWPLQFGPVPVGRKGIVEVTIDDRGHVEMAAIRQSLDPRYDSILLGAARQWRYTPAVKDGKPVKYRKRIQVVLER